MLTKLSPCLVMSKKQGADLLARLTKAVNDKKRTVEENSPPETTKKIKITLDLTAKPETAGDYLNKRLNSSSSQDRYYEYQTYKKNCPKLLPSVQLELDQLVLQGLRVENVDVSVPHLNPCGSMPLLPALGNKLGLSLDHILAPPVTDCLLCDRQLTKHHPPVQVSLLGLNGPSLASKYAWRCRNCPVIPDEGFFFIFFLLYHSKIANFFLSKF